MAAKQGMLHRGSGVALWRQIADRIRSEYVVVAHENTRLPPETELAAHFDVNRHTVRAAMAALIQEGVVEAIQGRGTFVRGGKRLRYPIGRRTRFSEGLAGQARIKQSKLVGYRAEPAPADVAQALGMDAGTAMLRVETLGTADGVAVSRVTSWFPAERFAGLPAVIEASGSNTTALRECGVDDYVRVSTRIHARHADAQDMAGLGLSAGAIILVTEAVNAEPEEQPFQYSLTRFAADRVELSVG